MNKIIDYSNRPWDKNNEFTEGRLFQTDFWTVEISYKQHTPLSYILFLNRKAIRFSDLNQQEISELPVVMKEIESILESHPSLKPDKFNYLQLGNHIEHLHIHGVPRYKSERFFVNKKWVDKTYGNPPQWTTIISDHKEITLMRNELISFLF